MEKKREYKLPETLRQLMDKHPLTGEKTTQREYLPIDRNVLKWSKEG